MEAVIDEAKAIAQANAEQTDRVQHGGFVEVREKPSGKLLFKIAPQRELIEVILRKRKTLIDLTEYGLVYRGHPDGGFV